MRISHNLAAMNTQRMLGINDKKKIGTAEKLSSGYKINRAADDAAGLSISEKMRKLIRGLMQGTDNAQDGVSWVQIGDGALNEAHEILHRMTELTVKALNGTNSESDRMALELEFEQLQCELDKIGNNTKFNNMPVFDKHQVPYYQCEGAVKWDSQQKHVVAQPQNKLIIEYAIKEPGKERLEIEVPEGEYTTQELVDEIDTVLTQMGHKDIVFEFTADGYCNANLEGGETIHNVSGGLSYLVYDTYKGGSLGALIGTTSFPNEYSRLKVVTGQNDSMDFIIEGFDGSNQQKSIQIPPGSYTRSELIDLLNGQLTGTPVEATAYGQGIKLGSDEAIVTGFKGNMFKIDGGSPVYNSVFYDNVKYGGVVMDPAVFTGGGVLPTDARDEEHKYYRIDNSNNTLVIQANDMDVPVTLTIGDGEYTATSMATELNRIFADAGIDLTAKRITTNSGTFEGIQITSGIEGPDSNIQIDSTNSSAYSTLFTRKDYNQYGSKKYAVNEVNADKEGVFKASKDLSILSSEPLTVTAGVNDSFKLTLNGVDYDIKLTADTYDSIDDVVNELDAQLNGSGALTGYKGKLAVSAVDNKIVLTGVAGQGVNTVNVTSAPTADVFNSVFQGYTPKITYPTAAGDGTVILNTPYDGTIEPSESTLTITVGGIRHNVTLPTGTVDKATVETTIENAIKAQTTEINNTFSTITDIGETSSRNFGPKTAHGITSVSSWSNTVRGSSEQQEGIVGFTSSIPAKLEVGPSLQNSMKVTSANNSITLNINGTTKTLTLEDGTYTQDSLKNALQQKIDTAFGDTGRNGAIVSVSGNKLVLTARLPQGDDGAQTSISCSTANSTFLTELATTRRPATWTSTNALNSSITINDSNREFNFTYVEGGSSQSITLNLTPGTYNQSSMVTELNNQLAKTSTGVTASLDSGKLVLKSTEMGSDVAITYGTTTGGNSAEALFGPLTNSTPANIVLGRDTLDTIKIETGVSDSFTIKVNGASQTVTLDDGTYNRDDFVDMLNTKLSGVQAYVSGDRIGFKTDAVGASASLGMSYGEGGSSMKAIYGTTRVTIPGVDISFNAENKMVINSTDGSRISVSSQNGGSAFQQPVVTYTKINTQTTTGYHSSTKSYIDGANWSGDLTIDKWNNNLNFTFKNNGVNQNVSVQISEDTYSQAELQDKLQDLLDAQVGADKIAVTVNSYGVRLEAVKPGNQYQFSNFSGDFYDKVICSCSERSTAVTVDNKAGTQTVDGVYTVGRKSVKDGVEIKRGISDELTLDLTFGNTVHSINVTLDAGKYSGGQLKTHLQDKINEQLQSMGLPENLIEVGIGGINTGVHGANDSSALNFSLSKTVQAPAEGQFIIDGVRGNAAFEIFYQTEGKLEPAYLVGTKDVSKGVTIYPGEEDLSVEVDGTTYSIIIPAGGYSATELRDKVNDLLDAAGAPVIAAVDDGKLKLTHRRLGEHEIQKVSGNAKEEIFFQENGEKNPNASRHVQLSSEVEDQIELNRHIFTTASLGLNSLCISRERNAQKALDRIGQALTMVSEIRSDFGSTQNRLEHAINNNENKAENLQSAESVIRDADMAEQMVELSKRNILLQAGQAMLTQANQTPQGVLSLLS